MGEIRATGVGVGHNSRRYQRDVLVHPVVRFEAPDGRTVEVESEKGSNAPPGVGDEVEVIYDPLSPEEAKLPLGSTLWFGPKALVVAGGLVLGVAILFFQFFLMMLLLVFL